jgi:hypothetical protein
MLPLILFFLNTQEFLLWSLFTAIGGLLLQIEAAIQSILVRDITKNANSSPNNVLQSISFAKKSYRLFAVLAFLFLTLVGIPYFYVSKINISTSLWLFCWVVFSATYFFNFLFGPNNCKLIATQNTTKYNVNNMSSRLINLALVAALLAMGCGFYALISGFAISVALGCSLNAHAARESKLHVSESLSSDVHDATVSAPRLSEIARFSLFLGLSYWLYRLLLLANATSSGDHAANASFALALQLFAIFMTLALTPLQMRVAPLISALKRKDRDEAALEFCRLQVLVNGVIILSTMMFLVATPFIGNFVSINIEWPSFSIVAALSFAFLIEANLQAVANLFISERDYRFVIPYCFSAIIAVSVGIIMTFSAFSIEMSIFAMALIQLTVALPSFIRLLIKTINLDISVYRVVLDQSITKILRS